MNSRKTDYLHFKPYRLSFAPLKNLLMLLGLIASSAFTQAQGSAHEQLTLNGLAAHWALGREYYIGSLYLPETSNDPEAILAMDGLKRMEFKVTNEKWSPRRFAQMWNQAILINNKPEDLNAVSDAIIAFTGFAKDNLIYGDHVLIDYTPGKGSKILLNGSLMFATKHESFFALLLNTWIGRRPPSSDFKTAILTLQTDEETEDLLSRFDVITPEKGRTATVAGWTAVAVATTKAVPPKAKAQAPKKAKTTTKPPKQTAKTEKKAESKVSASSNAAVIATVAAAATTIPASSVTASVASTSKPKPKAKTTPKPKTESKPASAQKTAKPATKTKQKTAKTESKTKKPKQKTTKKEPSKVVATKKPTISAAEKEKARIKGLRNLYRANMLRSTYRHVSYPSRAIKLKQEGTVVLKVTVNRKGKVLNIDKEEKSKYVSLNKAAEKAVKKSTPYPAIPEQLSGDKFEFKIPIRFRIPK